MAKATPSPIIEVTRRNLNPWVRLMLCVHAGGRCEFDGCNKYVLEHEVTLTQDVFAEVAHIVAFRKKGPRGEEGKRPADIAELNNLMLMCPTCHSLVDKNPDKYSRATLEEYKRGHEARIRYLTSFGPNRSAVLVVKAPIGGHAVAIPFEQVIAAMAPRYPISRQFTVVDLKVLPDDGPASTETAMAAIRKGVDRLFEPGGDAETAEHVSVFALAPIPLLVFLGRQLTNKVPADFYQRHRYPEHWSWKKGSGVVRYMFRRRRRGAKRIALVLSLSGSIPLTALPPAVRQSSTIYEITLRDRTPTPTFLHRRDDLWAFARVYQDALARISREHSLPESIDLFPAVPAPIAVLCGREALPKVHPHLRVYDYDKKKVGFTFSLEV